jgi:hypothetical protein
MGTSEERAHKKDLEVGERIILQGVLERTNLLHSFYYRGTVFTKLFPSHERETHIQTHRLMDVDI